VLREFRGLLAIGAVFAAFHYLSLKDALELSFAGVALTLVWIVASMEELHKRIPVPKPEEDDDDATGLDED
jgi:hypothetical protein